MKISILFLSLFACITAAFASSNSEFLVEGEQAFYDNDVPRLSALLDQASEQDQFVMRYRLAAMYMSAQDMVSAKSKVSSLISDLEAHVKSEPSDAEAWAILSSVYGMMAGLDPSKMITYGTKSGMAEGTAEQSDKNNSAVLLLIGINKVYTPEQYGGGHKNALRYLDSAVISYMADEDVRSWGFVDALVWRAKVNATLGNSEQAQKDIEAAIKLQPTFGFAISTLAEL